MFVSWWCRNEYFRPLPSSFWVLIFFYFFSLNYCTNGVGFLNATSVYRSIWQLLHLTFSYHLSSISGSWPKSFFCRECKLFFFCKIRIRHFRQMCPYENGRSKQSFVVHINWNFGGYYQRFFVFSFAFDLMWPYYMNSKLD